MAEGHASDAQRAENKSVLSPTVSTEVVGVAAVDTRMAEEVESECDTKGSV
jgi:hypothetical protein